jgi:hypothetical protein
VENGKPKGEWEALKGSGEWEGLKGRGEWGGVKGSGKPKRERGVENLCGGDDAMLGTTGSGGVSTTREVSY